MCGLNSMLFCPNGQRPMMLDRRPHKLGSAWGSRTPVLRLKVLCPNHWTNTPYSIFLNSKTQYLMIIATFPLSGGIFKFRTYNQYPIKDLNLYIFDIWQPSKATASTISPIGDKTIQFSNIQSITSSSVAFINSSS